MKAILLALVCLGVTAAKPTGDEDVVGSVIGVVKNCAEEDVSLCLKVCDCEVLKQWILRNK